MRAAAAWPCPPRPCSLYKFNSETLVRARSEGATARARAHADTYSTWHRQGGRAAQAAQVHRTIQRTVPPTHDHTRYITARTAHARPPRSSRGSRTSPGPGAAAAGAHMAYAHEGDGATCLCVPRHNSTRAPHAPRTHPWRMIHSNKGRGGRGGWGARRTGATPRGKEEGGEGRRSAPPTPNPSFTPAGGGRRGRSRAARRPRPAGRCGSPRGRRRSRAAARAARRRAARPAAPAAWRPPS